jgi:hypothetical protein
MEIEIVNQRLLDYYGRGLQDLPKYRIVWSSNEYEVRTGIYAKYTTAGIYLGEEKKTVRVKKYPMWDGFWILEYIQPNLANPELKANWSYEPIYIFKDRQSTPLPLDWHVIEAIVNFHRKGMSKPTPTSSEIEHEYEEQLEKEKAEMLDYLKHDEAFPNKMYDSGVVTVPHNYEGNYEDIKKPED